jgi:DNA-directed RNA polymerase subunit RPC12/RpoP
MTITKCDICKKEVKKNAASFSVSLRDLPTRFVSCTLCMDCGKPVAAFFLKHNLDSQKEGRRAA